MSGAALDLVRRAGQEQPLLIVLDDVFWIDRPSAEVLGFVARRLAGSHVGLLAALRTATGSVFEGSGLPRYQLEPLGWDAAERLVRARFPILGPDMRRRLLAEAAGNPLALLELPAALSGRRPFASPGSPALLPLSARLSELFASRVEQLPSATRCLLLLAVLDNTGDLAALQRATGDAELGDLAPAERSRLVHVDPETRRLVFRHPLTRSAVVELSTAQERREAHRALAGVRADEPQRQAWHLAEASVRPDERVAELLEATARQMLSRGDPVGAATALTRAAELSPTDVDRSRRLTKAAFVGVNMAGRLGDSEEIVAEALETRARARRLAASGHDRRVRAAQRRWRPGHGPPAAGESDRGSGRASSMRRTRISQPPSTCCCLSAASPAAPSCGPRTSRSSTASGQASPRTCCWPAGRCQIRSATRSRCSIASNRSSQSWAKSPTRGTFARSRWPRCSSTAWADAGRPSGAW